MSKVKFEVITENDESYVQATLCYPDATREIRRIPVESFGELVRASKRRLNTERNTGSAPTAEERKKQMERGK